MGFLTLSAYTNNHICSIELSRTLGQNEDQLIPELQDLKRSINENDDIRLVTIYAPDNSLNLPSENALGTEINGPDIVARIKKPVIIAMEGEITGWGLELCLACDLRIASDNSRFSMPQIANGSIPGQGGTQRLSRLVGKGKALEMILTCAEVDAEEALRIGLINRAVTVSDLKTATDSMAQKMAANGPLALRYVKEAIYDGLDMTLKQGISLELDLYMLLHTSQDRKAGIKAFREKRKADFQGK